VLGSVSGGGAFNLDRPMTVVEAIARAKGLQTTLQARNVVEAADLRRAFLARHGQRMQVDLERLFTRGDLSQNVQLEPEDYLYIPATELRQVYVVGEINTPGAAAYSPNLSVLAAVAEQGGFSSRAWKKNILVVRGSLTQPQTYVVNANEVIAGKTPDFRLEPGDIIYVHYRPWIYAEELLNIATSSFVQSVVITWTGLHVGPLITAPLF
jgi:protein involved in polysaccharide export with SLBB domain